MNVRCIYVDAAGAVSAASLLHPLDISLENLPLALSDDTVGSMEAQLAAQYAPPMCTAAATGTAATDAGSACDPFIPLVLSPLSQRCFDFLAGYSSAWRIPCAVFGKEAIAGIPPAFSACFVPLKTRAELVSYFSAKNEAAKKDELDRNAAKARQTLLTMGIPPDTEALVHCVQGGGLYELFLFLAAGFSPDTLSSCGVPILNLAARNGNRAALRSLYHAGAQINLLSHDRGSSALIDSVIAKHSDIAKDLIMAGADVNTVTKDGQSALIVVTGAGDAEMAGLLFKAGADPDIFDSLGMSARKYAALFRFSDITAIFDECA